MRLSVSLNVFLTPTLTERRFLSESVKPGVNELSPGELLLLPLLLMARLEIAAWRTDRHKNYIKGREKNTPPERWDNCEKNWKIKSSQRKVKMQPGWSWTFRNNREQGGLRPQRKLECPSGCPLKHFVMILGVYQWTWLFLGNFEPTNRLRYYNEVLANKYVVSIDVYS